MPDSKVRARALCDLQLLLLLIAGCLQLLHLLAQGAHLSLKLTHTAALCRQLLQKQLGLVSNFA